MSENRLEQAQKWRNLVLLAELGGWLHDLGKLSSGFVREHVGPAYNPPGEAEPSPAEEKEESEQGKGKEKWHHERIFEYDAKVLRDALEKALWQPLTGAEGWLKGQEARLGSDLVGLGDLVRGHHGEEWGNLLYLQRLLKRADGDDSGEDEYNAVELSQQEPVRASTVFGREKMLAKGDLEALDKQRQNLYPELARLLTKGESPANRRAVWQLLQKVMRQGLGKTQRAANDVRLDQHAWSVASRFKAFLLRDLLDPPPAGQKYPRRTFRLLTVWWNSWELITPFARLSDVVGREEMLKELRKRLRQAIEEEYALGNRVYEDDDGVHFLIADLPWGRDLTGLVRGIVNQVTGGEVQPVVRLSPPTQRVTELVPQMEEARKELPVVGDPDWVCQWPDSPSGEVCPVCQRRPLEGERDLCPWCSDWRGKGIKKRLEGDKGTVWTGEIADDHGRVALIVARFGLKQWLNGKMLHTMFITSPEDMEADPKIPVPVKDWAEVYQAIDQISAQWLEPVAVEEIERREKEVRAWGKERKNTPAGQLARWLLTRQFGRWQHVAETAVYLRNRYGLPLKDAFLLALARKNPSASRLLRVWQMTEEFLQQQARRLEVLVKERQRVVFTLDKTPPSGIYKVEVPVLGREEVFVRPEDGKVQTINFLTQALRPLRERLQGKKLHFLARERGRPLSDEEKEPRFIQSIELEPYLPYQAITVSPNLFLVMVPADKALEVAERLQKAHVQEFGKVQGRLPFHVGLAFMNDRYPMFAALDTARRLVENFDHLDEVFFDATLEKKPEKEGDNYELILGSSRFETWTWHVPDKRGDLKTDWYHPYFLVRKEENQEKHGMSLVGPEGRWVHVSKLQKDDRIAFRPNLFDFLFLDTVSRRLEAHIDPKTGCRPHPLLGSQYSPRPYLLARVHHFRKVWKEICQVGGMSETRLEAATSLLSRKWKSWQLAEKDTSKEEWATYRWLVEQVVARDFNGSPIIQKAILDGSFFDVVDLFRHILKEKIEHAPAEERKEVSR